MLSSCSSVQKVIVNGKPGTEIYTPNLKKVTTISDDGVAIVEINKKNTYHFLISRENGSGEFIPFGLNFEKKSAAGVKLGKYTSIAIAAAGCYTELMGLVFFLFDEPEVGSILTLAGLGGVLVGAPLVSIFGTRADYDQNKYKYKYLEEQKTNQDILLSPLKQTADYKTVSRKKYHKPSYEMVKVEKNEIKEKKYMDFSDNKQEEKPIAINNSSSTDSKSKYVQNVSTNHSQQVVGTYYGYGRLMSDNELVERYDNLKIVVSKRTDNMVKVDVYIRNSIPYFNSDNIYNISKTYNEYTLHHTTNDSYITIDENGILNFTYKNIRNKGYVLKATAEIK